MLLNIFVETMIDFIQDSLKNRKENIYFGNKGMYVYI